MTDRKQPAANSYRSILKGTTLFGGVQVFQILINLVRGKFVAMILGPDGMGVSSLFMTSSVTLQRFASLGLNLAVVKEVAATDPADVRFGTVMAVARRLIAATAWLGAILCVVLAPLLSRWTFGDPSMTWQFVLMGAAVGLTVAANGKLSVLQGLHEVKAISWTSVIGGATGLVAGVPLYWFFGTKGIVPAMVVLALVLYIFYSVVLHRRHPGVHGAFGWRDNWPLVRKLTVLGLFLLTNDLLGSLVQYLLNLYINGTGSTDAVGLYQAANSITNQYMGMVFAAMAMDYFPRLSAIAADNAGMRTVVNRQTEIVALIIAPCTVLLILTAPVLIRILLTEQFAGVMPLMRWMGLGILVRALSFPMGYISFAKGNRKLFFWMEGVFCNTLTLVLSCAGYRLFGLIGLGYALVADNAICVAVYYAVNRRLYGYRLSRGALVHMLSAVAIGTAGFMTVDLGEGVLAPVLCTCVLVLAAVWAFASLRRKLKTPGDA